MQPQSTLSHTHSRRICSSSHPDERICFHEIEGVDNNNWRFVHTCTNDLRWYWEHFLTCLEYSAIDMVWSSHYRSLDGCCAKWKVSFNSIMNNDHSNAHSIVDFDPFSAVKFIHTTIIIYNAINKWPSLSIARCMQWQQQRRWQRCEECTFNIQSTL